MHARMLAPGHRMTADMIANKAPIELSDGQPILCLPTLSRGGSAQNLGAAVIQSDPAVDYAGTDVGFSPKPDMLRAPDVAVLPGPPQDGWLKEPPPLAVEYADRGQNQADLKKKIREYLENGVRLVWVVRMDGPRRVEVYTPDGKKEMFGPGKILLAPGILANPVPVEALYEPQAAHQTVLRNMLAREGYSSLEAVFEEGKDLGKAEGREEGREEGRSEGLLEGTARGLARGREEGRRQGKEEGKEEGQVAGLLQVYVARFGAAPEWMPTALVSRQSEALSALFALFAMESQQQIAMELGKEPSN